MGGESRNTHHIIDSGKNSNKNGIKIRSTIVIKMNITLATKDMYRKPEECPLDSC